MRMPPDLATTSGHGTPSSRVCLFPQKSELGDLQRKSPDDLWKGDLAVFVEELEVSSAPPHLTETKPTLLKPFDHSSKLFSS